MQVVRLTLQRHDFRQSVPTRPLSPENLSDLLVVLNCSLANRENWVLQPGGANGLELLVEELLAELASKNGDLLHHGQLDAPVFVLG